MTTKIAAFVVSLVSAGLFITSRLWPNDPYFFIVSSNVVTATARLVLAGLMIKLAFGRRIQRRSTSHLYLGLAAALLGLGVAGLSMQSLDYALFNIIKPLDYIFIVGLGSLLACAGLGYRYEPEIKKLNWFSSPHPFQLRLIRLRLPPLHSPPLSLFQLRLSIIKHVHT